MDLWSRRELGLSVADWLDIHDPVAVRQTPFYNDVVVPNRLLAPIFISADIASNSLPAVLSFYSESETTARAELRRRKQILQLAVPAFRAGVAARIWSGRQRATLTSFIDAAPTGVMLLNAEGGVLHENNSVRQILGADPERERIRAEVKRVAQRVARLVTRRATSDWMSKPVTAEVRTVIGRYRITATFLEVGFGAAAAVVAIVDRVTAMPFDASELATRFRLTAREIESAELLRTGCSSRQIAGVLGISVNTARRHVERVLSKLDVHTRTAAASKLSGN
jgi:DNA-binding CsgD family transcriptional regulator